jgi:hypothetical protein
MPNAALQAVQFTLLESELKSMKSALTSLHKIGQNLMIEARPSEVPPAYMKEKLLLPALSEKKKKKFISSVNVFIFQIHFRTVNSSRSGYMSITCGASFFQEYHVFHCDVLYAVLLFKVRKARISIVMVSVAEAYCRFQNRAYCFLHCSI